MKPIGPLMLEHRLIEKMARLFNGEIARIREQNKVNTVFIISAVDFFRTYADRTHHGKEEDILFRDLATKNLSPEHERIMKELIEEHILARKTVGRLLEANKKYLEGDSTSSAEVVQCLQKIVDLYPKHIEKEDKHFFYPSMQYVQEKEQESMLQKFHEYNRTFTDNRYKTVVETLEKDD